MPSSVPDSKKCSRCKIEKPLSEFRKGSGKYGYTSHCNLCDNARGQQRRREKDGLIKDIYKSQRNHAKKEKTNLVLYTRDEFIVWIENQEIFTILHKQWVDSDYDKYLTPSCYRIDTYLPYRLNNIGISTWKDVQKKFGQDTKKGINNKISKSVLQYTKDGIFIKEYHSMQEAERQTGVPNGGICNCCQGKAKSAGGYTWKYNTKPTEKTKFGEKIEVKHLNNYLFEDIEEILGSEISIDTEKEELVKCRIGQGKFRDNLIEYWNGCSVTNYKNDRFLVASHIKPWRSSTNKERLDVFNGLLLIPNLDKLFDSGYISFKDNGEILISKELIDYETLGVKKNMKIIINEQHKKYLKFHRNNIFEI